MRLGLEPRSSQYGVRSRSRHSGEGVPTPGTERDEVAVRDAADCTISSKPGETRSRT